LLPPPKGRRRTSLLRSPPITDGNKPASRRENWSARRKMPRFSRRVPPDSAFETGQNRKADSEKRKPGGKGERKTPREKGGSAPRKIRIKMERQGHSNVSKRRAKIGDGVEEEKVRADRGEGNSSSIRARVFGGRKKVI